MPCSPPHGKLRICQAKLALAQMVVTGACGPFVRPSPETRIATQVGRLVYDTLRGGPVQHLPHIAQSPGARVANW
ncbi:hypothetical protein L226DRAFT_529811 [Lentinus tigrinus ALCF2SS1-7]|uniref:uncharacterized protein n=1 Tax=Lentinus tigrinus ALCF2SS1-7 TaxID=1328758 RepID=UPI0011660407|nr:hypothetical protein L226DRAFT_529811 [Lentinus tigrinus ALCF2SS1-7]